MQGVKSTPESLFGYQPSKHRLSSHAAGFKVSSSYQTVLSWSLHVQMALLLLIWRGRRDPNAKSFGVTVRSPSCSTKLILGDHHQCRRSLLSLRGPPTATYARPVHRPAYRAHSAGLSSTPGSLPQYTNRLGRPPYLSQQWAHRTPPLSMASPRSRTTSSSAPPAINPPVARLAG